MMYFYIPHDFPLEHLPLLTSSPDLNPSPSMIVGGMWFLPRHPLIKSNLSY